MRIQEVYIACYKYDLRFTRILVASIRNWYPDLPIRLIKDRFYGDFDTLEIEETWNVSRLECERKVFGWGFAKLEPLFLPTGSRCLILDSDIAFVGPALEALEPLDADFIVQQEASSPEFVESHYFDLPALQKLDPSFAFPGFTFNTGQLVATTGFLKREDFLPFVDWNAAPPQVLAPEVFKLGEQGLLNYTLMKMRQEGRITLDHARFMNVPGCDDCPQVGLDQLGPCSPHQRLFHWCGRKRPRIAAMEQGAILQHFEQLYYRPVPFGAAKKWTRIALDRGEQTARAWARKTPLRLLRRNKGAAQ